MLRRSEQRRRADRVVELIGPGLASLGQVRRRTEPCEAGDLNCGKTGVGRVRRCVHDSGQRIAAGIGEDALRVETSILHDEVGLVEGIAEPQRVQQRRTEGVVLFEKNGLAERCIGVSAAQRSRAASDLPAVVGNKVTAQGIVRRQSVVDADQPGVVVQHTTYVRLVVSTVGCQRIARLL